MNAIRNWWGTVSGPLANDVIGTVAVNPFLIYSINSTVTASNSAPNVGQQFHYIITVTNNGPDAATDVQVTDGIPAGLTFDRYVASQGTYNHATEIWNVRTLASGASATLELFVTPTASVAGTIITKVATLVNTNTTDTTTVSVPSTPLSLVLTKTTSNTEPNVGQQYRYDIIVANIGPNTSTGVHVTDVLPAGIVFNSYTASKGIFNSASGIWAVGNLASGTSAILHLFVTPTASVAGTIITNAASIPGQIANVPIFVTTTVQNNGTNTGNNTTNTVNAETETIAMPHTAVPIAGLILAILMVLGGTIIPRVKK